MRRPVFMALILAFFASAAYAGTGAVPGPCMRFREDFPQTKGDIVRGPAPGICEIHAGTNVLYYIPRKSCKGLLFLGDIYTPKGVNLTQQARDSLVAGVAASLPVDRAIKIGNGRVKVVEFTDPDCPFCRRLEHYFAAHPEITKKITRYVFLDPLTQLHPKSEAKTRWILSQKDKAKALEDVMLKGSLDGKEFWIPINSKDDLLRVYQDAAQKMGVQGTPFLIVNDKVMINGANVPEITNAIDSAFGRIRRSCSKKHRRPKKALLKALRDGC